MGNRKVSVSRLDPTKQATAEEVALVIEQGSSYLEFLTDQRKKLYNTCATLDDFIEANALQGISYEKLSRANNSLNPDSISHILIYLRIQSKFLWQSQASQTWYTMPKSSVNLRTAYIPPHIRYK